MKNKVKEWKETVDWASAFRSVLRHAYLKGAHRAIRMLPRPVISAPTGLGATLKYDLAQANELHTYYLIGDDQ